MPDDHEVLHQSVQRLLKALHELPGQPPFYRAWESDDTAARKKAKSRGISPALVLPGPESGGLARNYLKGVAVQTDQALSLTTRVAVHPHHLLSYDLRIAGWRLARQR